ncbi:MAG: MoxR family ATPase [Thermoplasmata archaeon]|nr:MoxR family ATPase [Thermoplasmata archaeon]
MTIEEASALSYKLITEVSNTVLGKRYVLEMVMVSILANGNILFEDYPGLAKTLIAKTFAGALGCNYKRIQFTPDLLPSDITGTYVFNPKDVSFELHSGPIFTNILLADEINRAPPKTQAALLEAMQERQVTIEGNTITISKPFVVFATQNPIEYEGTYPLPEAQLDRFIMKLSVGYPDEEVERQILINRYQRKEDDVPVETVTDTRTVVEMQKAMEEVYVDTRIIQYIVAIVQMTRQDPRVQVGSSPRGSQAIFKLSRGVAVLSGRNYVTPDDIKHVVIPALKHRLILKPEPRIRGIRPEDILAEVLTNVPVPTSAETMIQQQPL